MKWVFLGLTITLLVVTVGAAGFTLYSAHAAHVTATTTAAAATTASASISPVAAGLGITVILGAATLGFAAATVAIHRDDRNQQREGNDLNNRTEDLQNSQPEKNQRQENLANLARNAFSSMPPDSGPHTFNFNVTDKSTNKYQYNPTKLTATDHSNISGVNVANGPRP